MLRTLHMSDTTKHPRCLQGEVRAVDRSTLASTPAGNGRPSIASNARKEGGRLDTQFQTHPGRRERDTTYTPVYPETPENPTPEIIPEPPDPESEDEFPPDSQGIGWSKQVEKEANAAPDDTVEADSAPVKKGAMGARKEPQISGYLIRKWVGSKAQLEWITELVEGYSPAQRHMFLHVLISRLIRHGRRGPWVPVSAALMFRDLPDCPWTTEHVWRPLQNEGLLEVDDSYSYALKESREFTVPSVLVEAFLHRGAKEGDEPRFDLVTGKRCRKRTAQKTTLKDTSGHYYPELIDRVLRHFQGVRRLINYAAIDRHVQLRYEAACEAYEVCKAEGFLEGSAARKAYEKALGQYETDWFAFDLIKHQALRHEHGDIWSYIPAYDVQKISGRLTEVGGGLQSCSREMKAASIEGLHYINYDVTSSQLYGLRQGFEEAHIDTKPIDALLVWDKKRLAAGIGVSVDTYKGMLYAMLFHGSLYPTLQDALDSAEKHRRQVGSIAKAILEDTGCTDPHEAHAAFSELMQPLYKALKKWHKWLVGPYWRKVRQKNRGYFATNDCGIVFRKSDWERGHEQKSKMAAWYLQGKEACLIHHLALLGSKYGYTAVANEHDGLLIDGEIPQEAFDEALHLANFKNAQFEIKPIGTALWSK
jgi:hypothetical protein